MIKVEVKKSNKLCSLKECCGCSSCAISCPVGSISMAWQRGSYRPRIDTGTCIDCGICIDTCQILNEDLDRAANLDSATCFVAVVKDKNILKRSSSGGIAYALSVAAISEGMSVCGASYSAVGEECAHIVCNTVDKIVLTQGSKYLQSVNYKAFAEMASMDCGLVIGTPCQIAGMDSILRRREKRDQFVLVDIFCHGVPNQLLWENHLRWLRETKQVNTENTAVFRQNKNFILHIGEYNSWYNEDAFYTYFLRGWLYNQSCYSCKYRRLSCADIRLGDLLVKKYASLSYSPSCVLSISEAGAAFLGKTRDSIELYPESYETIDEAQEGASKPIPKNYNEMIEKLQRGLPPELLIKKTMVLGRIKSFIKHGLLVKLTEPNRPSASLTELVDDVIYKRK